MFIQEKLFLMDSYEEYKEIIIVKCNAVAANKEREECWQKLLIV